MSIYMISCSDNIQKIPNVISQKTGFRDIHLSPEDAVDYDTFGGISKSPAGRSDDL